MLMRASVENNGFDVGDPRDGNLKVHVGEGVTSFLWRDVVTFFYSAWRFLGKVWYERAIGTPCAPVSDAPSPVPTGQPTTASRVAMTDGPTISVEPTAAPTKTPSLSVCTRHSGPS